MFTVAIALNPKGHRFTFALEVETWVATSLSHGKGRVLQPYRELKTQRCSNFTCDWDCESLRSQP